MLAASGLEGKRAGVGGLEPFRHALPAEAGLDERAARAADAVGGGAIFQVNELWWMTFYTTV